MRTIWPDLGDFSVLDMASGKCPSAPSGLAQTLPHPVKSNGCNTFYFENHAKQLTIGMADNILLLTMHVIKFAGKEMSIRMLEKIADIIREQLNLEDVEITEDTSFKDDLQADSLDLFELVMAFEEEYGIEIPSEDLEKFSTVGDIMEYIKAQDLDV